MEDIQESIGAGAHEYQVGKSKRYWCHTEVRDLLEKLRSWREESNRQLSNIIDSHTNSISKGINDLAEEICDLQSKLSVTTQEKNNLLENVDKLSSENRQLKAVIRIVQPLQGLEENQRKNNQVGDNHEYSNTKEQGVESPRISSDNGDQDHHLPIG